MLEFLFIINGYTKMCDDKETGSSDKPNLYNQVRHSADMRPSNIELHTAWTAGYSTYHTTCIYMVVAVLGKAQDPF